MHNLAIATYREVGDRLGEANTLKAIGYHYQAAGQDAQAIQQYEGALSLYRATGSRWGEAMTLQALAVLYQKAGRVQDGLQAGYQAAQILQELDIPLAVMPYPKWMLSIIQSGQKGWVQLSVCFAMGLIAFPFAILFLALLTIWRLLRAQLKRTRTSREDRQSGLIIQTTAMGTN